jgi:hypothetical protein
MSIILGIEMVIALGLTLGIVLDLTLVIALGLAIVIVTPKIRPHDGKCPPMESAPHGNLPYNGKPPVGINRDLYPTCQNKSGCYLRDDCIAVTPQSSHSGG